MINSAKFLVKFCKDGNSHDTVPTMGKSLNQSTHDAKFCLITHVGLRAALVNCSFIIHSQTEQTVQQQESDVWVTHT